MKHVQSSACLLACSDNRPSKNVPLRRHRSTIYAFSKTAPIIPLNDPQREAHFLPASVISFENSKGVSRGILNKSSRVTCMYGVFDASRVTLWS